MFHRIKQAGQPTAIAIGILIGLCSTSLFAHEPAVDDDAFDKALAGFMRSELSRQEIEAGWLSLCDGDTRFGWSRTGDANFRNRNGTLFVSEGTKPSLLRTRLQFDNYILRLRFLTDRETNSGIFLRTSPNPVSPTVDCYELNFADEGSNPFPTGSLVGRKLRTKAVDDVVAWQDLEATVLGDHITVKIDGIVVCEYTDPAPLGRGYIGLQYNSGRAAFGDIRLKPLSLEPLFDGTDLDQWTTHPDLEGEFNITDEGDLQVLGGRGQLETKESYADFVLQLECKTQAEGLNSGVFFRCIPGEIMNGYESQIHNLYHGDDPSSPVDCGTGGIFRQQDTRKVLSMDRKWFSMSIIAVGPNIGVWVEGQQVVDWRDGRAPDPNPRRGRRLEAGSIMLQAHDVTTDVLFRDINVKEIDARKRK